MPLLTQSFVPDRLGKPTEKYDVYSFGMILWEMMTGRIPWRDEANEWMVRALLLLLFPFSSLDLHSLLLFSMYHGICRVIE